MVSTPLDDENDSMPVSPTPESSSDAYSCIPNKAQINLDDEIAILMSKLHSLRSRRNALSPISRLPPEILASIFIYNARSHLHRRIGVPKWVQVSYVCRYWQEVALSTPVLWSYLFVSSKQWTDKLFTRSKAAPLSVCVRSRYGGTPKELYFWKKVALQANRIQDLTLRFECDKAEDILPLFFLPAPLLLSLRISMPDPECPSLRSKIILFDGHTPALRDLELINYAFLLTSPTLSGLTSLKLSELGPSFRPTLAELRVALDRMHDLIHLHLENALPSAHFKPESLNTSGKLHFPRLSRLMIVAPFSTVTYLLSLFDLPLQTEVRLSCCYESHPEDPTPIYDLIAQRFVVSEDQEHTLAPIIRACFVEAMSKITGFVFSTLECDPYRCAFPVNMMTWDCGQLCEDWDCGIPLKVDLLLPDLWDHERLVGDIYRNIPLTNLESAHFSFGSVARLSSDFWRGIFGYLGELRHIWLSMVDLQGLAQALTLDVETRHNDPVPFPALQELKFRCPWNYICQAKSACCCVGTLHLYGALASRQTAGRGRSIFLDRMKESPMYATPDGTGSDTSDESDF